MNRIKNAKKQTIDGVLFLKGVFKNDCDKIEDFFHDRLLHDSSNSKIYDKIPLVFTGLDCWPKTLNIPCFSCHRTFKTIPWPIPQSLNLINDKKSGDFVAPKDLVRNGTISKKYCINVGGITCSGPCAARYIIVHSKNIAERNDKLAMLYIEGELITTQKITHIEPAAYFTERIEYGGTLTNVEFQKIIDDNMKSALTEDKAFVNNCVNFLSRCL